MLGILATKDTTFIIGDVAKILGWIMDQIFIFLSKVFGIENIGLTIILFTFIIYLLMLPLTIRQQKFSKLSAKMNPEIQAIQKKYKGKKDQQSMLAMQEETKVIYQKYGTSPTGGCLPLIIQMPILFALYRVIANIPAYVTPIKNSYSTLVTGIMADPNYQTIMEEMGKSKAISPSRYDYTKADTIIDVLYKFGTNEWTTLSEKFPNLADSISTTSAQVAHMNSFLGGINIADNPLSHGILSIAILVPILAGLTQWINVKLMPQPQTTTADSENPMMASMKTMNVMMPIMSAIFAFSMPIGLGLYWIAGSVFRSIQQVLINRHLDHVDIDALIEKNQEKVKKRNEKLGISAKTNTLSNTAKANVKNIEPVKKNVTTEEEKKDKVKDSTEYYKNGNAKPGSLAAKANMVKQFNERNNK